MTQWEETWVRTQYFCGSYLCAARFRFEAAGVKMGQNSPQRRCGSGNERLVFGLAHKRDLSPSASASSQVGIMVTSEAPGVW